MIQNQMYSRQTPMHEGYYPQVPLEFPTQLQVPVPSGAPIPAYPGAPSPVYPGAPIPAYPGVPSPIPMPTAPAITPEGLLPLEQSYIENILRFNIGKMATLYQTFEYNPEWPAKVFRGLIVAAGRDHIIISNPETGKNYLLLMVNLDYVEFDEPIEYIPPPFPGVTPPIQGISPPISPR